MTPICPPGRAFGACQVAKFTCQILIITLFFLGFQNATDDVDLDYVILPCTHDGPWQRPNAQTRFIGISMSSRRLRVYIYGRVVLGYGLAVPFAERLRNTYGIFSMRAGSSLSAAGFGGMGDLQSSQASSNLAALMMLPRADERREIARLREVTINPTERFASLGKVGRYLRYGPEE